MKYTPDFSSRFRILKGGKISLVVSALVAGSTMSFAAPSGGTVTTGSATINQSGSVTTINQSTNKASINWNSFSIAPSETVNFVQPSAQSVTLNRVIGTSQSLIQGAMNANGHVFLLNPNGVLFTNGSQINVGGLVASTLNITDTNFQAGNYVFEGNSQNSIINMGTITAHNGGYVAMMGKTVQNEGTIVATMGNVQMASGEKISLNLNGNSLVKLTIDQGTLNALVENKGLIQADGGEVYLTTQALNTILDGMVNNTGIIEAQTLNDVTGKVILFAHGGTANISGTVDARGGFVETSGKELGVAEGTVIKAKTWLLDPVNVTINGSTDAIGGTTVGASVIETALSSGGGNTDVIITADNDITVNEALDWSANKLTLSAGNNIAVNADMTATGTGSLAFKYGQSTANGGTSRYTIADGIDIIIPGADKFTWQKGSGGIVNNLVLNNNKIRFGDGTEESLTQEGTLKQPWYYDEPRTDSDNGDDWFQLTYSDYPLDIQIAVGGDGSDTWNENGTLYNTDEGTYTPLTSNLNISGYYEGYGSIISTITLDANTEIKNTYTLTQSDMYLKTVTEVTNLHSTDSLNNVRAWVGTRDDYIATNDDPSKTKGNLTSNGFEAIATQDTQAKALQITENEDGTGAAVLFYSTSANADVAFESCCSFSNVTGINPRTSDIYIDQDDGSYAMFMRMNDLTPGQSQSMIWYYAAGPVSQLNSIVNQVSSSAGVSSPPSTPTPPSTPPAEPEQQQVVNNIVTTIVNSTTVTPPAPIVVAPLAPQPQQVQTQAQNNTLLQTILPQSSTNGGSFGLVGSTDGSSSVQTVTMEQLQSAATAQGMGEIRVPLANNSMVELVNGGVNLPNGVSQEFYVVDNNTNQEKKN